MRGEKNLTQSQMGELLGVSKNYVYMLEKGTKVPSNKVIVKLDRIEASESNLRFLCDHERAHKEIQTIDESDEPHGQPPNIWTDMDALQLEALLHVSVEKKEWGAVEKIASELFNRKLKGRLT